MSSRRPRCWCPARGPLVGRGQEGLPLHFCHWLEGDVSSRWLKTSFRETVLTRQSLGGPKHHCHSNPYLGQVRWTQRSPSLSHEKSTLHLSAKGQKDCQVLHPHSKGGHRVKGGGECPPGLCSPITLTECLTHGLKKNLKTSSRKSPEQGSHNHFKHIA